MQKGDLRICAKPRALEVSYFSSVSKRHLLLAHLLELLDAVGQSEKQEIKRMFESKIDKNRLEKIRKMFVSSNALSKTQQTALYYINQAKCELDELENSDYKRSLNYLIDYIVPGKLFNSVG